MPLIGGPSSPTLGDSIDRFLMQTFGTGATEEAFHEMDAQSKAFQQWKYWDPHPLFLHSRSYVLLAGETIVAHGCCWPIRLQAAFGQVPSMHLIDWAAKRNVPGAGMRVFQLCQKDVGAVIAIGGSEMTRRILPAFGFKPYNNISFLYRPLRPFSPALSPGDWKMPARVLRNLGHYIFPRPSMLPGWSVSWTEPGDIPGSLFPRPLTDEAVSIRGPELLAHMMKCPTVQDAGCYILRRMDAVVAYFCLLCIQGRVRLVDFGPIGLDEQFATALGFAAQCVARSDFKRPFDIYVAATEPAVIRGFARSGFRTKAEEPIKVLKLNSELQNTTLFRLTLLDWDAAVLNRAL
jgi:hypothetical protein